jgi:Spy/CpxP family protein refolding chaperone
METTPGSTPSNDRNVPTRGTLNDKRGARRHCGEDGEGRCRRGRGRFFLFALIVAVVAGVAGGFVGKSFAHSHSMMRLSADPAKRDAQVERMVKRAASRIDATPEQQQKLTAIVKGAANDILPMRDKLRTAGRQAVALTAAPTVDRDGIERLRAEQVALADAVTKRVTQALADAAEVLTPEQRKKVAERIGSRMDRRERGGFFQG